MSAQALPPFDSMLGEHLTGEVCPDCHGYQVLTVDHLGVYHLATFHEDPCPALTESRPGQMVDGPSEAVLHVIETAIRDELHRALVRADHAGLAARIMVRVQMRLAAAGFLTRQVDHG